MSHLDQHAPMMAWGQEAGEGDGQAPGAKPGRSGSRVFPEDQPAASVASCGEAVKKCVEDFQGDDSYVRIGPRDEDRISFLTRVIFSAPTVATLPFLAMWGLYGNRTYQDLGASLSMIALFTALARSFDVVSDPLMSYITDSASFTNLPRWLNGRRKPFMFVGSFAYSVLLFCLVHPPYMSSTATSLWFGMFYSLFFISNTFTVIPYDALGPELSEDSGERTKLFFMSNLFDGLGTLFALGLPVLMISFATDFTSRNDWVCKDDRGRADMCLDARTCGDVFSTGEAGAFVYNNTLADLLAGLAAAPGGLAAVVATDPVKACLEWVRDPSTAESVLGPNATGDQNAGFCDCMDVCGDACTVANKRTGFMLVGVVFAVWMVVSMTAAVLYIEERPRPLNQPKAPPIVPSMRAALNNKLFCILLPAWLCDAFVQASSLTLVPYFVEAVVEPAYMTMEDNGHDCYESSPSYDGGQWIGEGGRDDSGTYDRLCSTDNVAAVCGGLALISAIMVLPVWQLLVRKLGKERTWLLWSCTMAFTNVLFVFVGKGQVRFLFFVSFVNGAPLGAKFLADSILSDIIDYDEFLTGMRSEATYFMFKSFLPKIVQIPAAAIPIAFLSVVGYLEPEGGRVQDQPESVSIYIRCVVGTAFLVSLISFFVKLRYPLCGERVHYLRVMLDRLKNKQWALDPVSMEPYKPMEVGSEAEMCAFWKFSHFSHEELQRTFWPIPSGDKAAEVFCQMASRLAWEVKLQLVGSIVFLVVSIGCTCGTLQLLEDDTWQFVPTIMVVCVGIGITSTAFCVLRLQAAREMCALIEREHHTLGDSVRRLLLHQAKLVKMKGVAQAGLQNIEEELKMLDERLGEELVSLESVEEVEQAKRISQQVRMHYQSSRSRSVLTSSRGIEEDGLPQERLAQLAPDPGGKLALPTAAEPVFDFDSPSQTSSSHGSKAPSLHEERPPSHESDEEAEKASDGRQSC